MDDAGMPAHPENPSAIALKKLRNRAGLSMDRLAKASGFKTASGIQRYENPTDRTSPYMPMDVVARLAGALTGLGTPPITEVEVYAELAGALPPRLANQVEMPTFLVTSSKPTNLPDGAKGLGLYSETGRLAIRLRLSRAAIRDIREDLDFLESVLPSE